MRRPDHHPDVPAELLTTDAAALVARDDVDLVVEVIGGIEPARSLLLAAFETGKSVVSANKALLAEDGVALHAAAAKSGVDLYYEAAVAGAIPLLRPLRESLAGDQLAPGGRHRQRHDQLHPVPDGRDRRRLRRGAGRGHRARLRRGRPDRRRRRLRRRREGGDPRLAGLPHPRSPPPTCTARASRAVTAADVARAAEIGCTVKLLAICERVAGRGRRLGRRPRAPGDDPDVRTRWPRSATRSTPSSSRPRRPGS